MLLASHIRRTVSRTSSRQLGSDFLLAPLPFVWFDQTLRMLMELIVVARIRSLDEHDHISWDIDFKPKSYFKSKNPLNF